MKLECANCGKVFDKDDDILTITDNQLILRYFDWPDGRDNAFLRIHYYPICGRKLIDENS
ncbi:MAG: hypothetical protein K2O75_03500 [Lactobacillus sp.]|uniref:hypothetical protein n=1 Tax=Lactobacillus sp. TaxID=1591 RepID=UPI0023C1A2C7|nr:hypothetical protein [Lactobacillus sp.]MDE7049914.1 hypothetical protein [Lactobacillus sp.]